MKQYIVYLVLCCSTVPVQCMGHYRFFDAPTKQSLYSPRAQHSHTVTFVDTFESAHTNAMYNALVNCHYFWQIGDYELSGNYWNEYIVLKHQQNSDR